MNKLWLMWNVNLGKEIVMFNIYDGKKLIALIIFAIVVATISGVSTYAFVKYLG